MQYPDCLPCSFGNFFMVIVVHASFSTDVIGGVLGLLQQEKQ